MRASTSLAPLLLFFLWAAASCAKDVPAPASSNASVPVGNDLPAPASDDLGPKWETNCLAPRGDAATVPCLSSQTPRPPAGSGEPMILCVPSSDAKAAQLEDFSTLQISLGDKPERRFALLPKETPPAAWRVLIEVPGDAVWVRQGVNDRPVCGPVATTFAASDCVATKENREGSTSDGHCILRPTPFDNPDFPRLPNPETGKPGYFAPWAAFEGPGQMPGDFDKLFSDNLLHLSSEPAPAGEDSLVPGQRRQLELLAWQEMLAMQWPVDDEDGSTRMNPAAGSSNHGTCPQWAGWRRRDEMMRGPEQLPIPWGLNPTSGGTGGICDSFLADSEVAMLSATGGLLGDAFHGSAQTGRQPDGHLLFDRNGLLVFYDVRVNRALYDYVLQQGLYRGGPGRNPVDFPHGQLWPTYGLGLLKAPPSYEGPMAAKFAWKQLTSCDNSDEFIQARANLGTISGKSVVEDMRTSGCSAHAAEGAAGTKLQQEALHLDFLSKAELLEPNDETHRKSAVQMLASTSNGAVAPKPASSACKPSCTGESCLLGLVALHVTHKTGTNGKWNWSTFVHRRALVSGDSGPALFDTDDCKDPGAKKTRNCNECEDGICRTQICRTQAIASGTAQLNEQVRTVLAGAETPLLQQLSNYELLGVQWVDTAGSDPRPFPASLLNPLLETFVDEGPEGSCFSCHQHATAGDLLFFLHNSVQKASPP